MSGGPERDGEPRFENRYGRVDRLLHRVAFRASTAQLAMADLEGALFADALEAVELGDPVFVSGLPRAGTTVLLEILASVDPFASHTYRDLPFVLCPMVWDRFSRGFAVDDEPRERAHGDGLTISADSPEAFEEMIWKRFWPDHYEERRIVPWSAEDADPEFDAWLEAHMRKIAALRRPDAAGPVRYLSKNNVQIARLDAPCRPLKRGTFVVPFREPVQHAASLLRQHRRFTRLQAEDGFLREYMDGIGHHDFGPGLKPVDFGGWLEEAPAPETLEFWLRYWVAGCRHVLDRVGPSTILVSYERLVEEPEGVLARLAGALEIPAPDLVSHAGRIRPPRVHPVDVDDVQGDLLEEAAALRIRLEDAVEPG